MSGKELRFTAGLSTTLRINDLHNDKGVVLHIDTGLNSLMAILDRNQQHLLMLYLKERLE